MTSKATGTFVQNKKLDKIVHKESNLVVNNQKEKLVIGRVFEKAFIPLEDDTEVEKTLQTCAEFGLKYDESLVQFEEESEEKEAEEEARSASDQREVEKVVEPLSERREARPSQEQSEPTPRKETVERAKSESPSDLSALLQKHTEEMIAFVKKVSSNSASMSELSAVKKELEETKKELDGTKKKLKALLATMQEQL